MKIIVFVALLLLVGCAAPRPPDPLHLYNEIMAGRMKAEDVNKVYDDYRQSRLEYESSTGYRLGTGALLLGLSATSIAASGGSYGSGCYRPSGSATISTNPTSTGGSITRVNWK